MTSSPVFFTWNVIVPVGAVPAVSRHSVAEDSTPIVPAPPLAGAFETQPAVSGTTTSARTATAGATGRACRRVIDPPVGGSGAGR